MNTTLQALAIHTELIHNDLVWQRLQSMLSVMSRRGGQATFFVYPFRAIVAGREEIAFERVKRLHEEGHEIGQHTHFYAGTAIDKPNKVTDLSNENVRYCLERDYQWLERIVSPQGFTSGGWAVPEALYPTLAKLGFRYDCSPLSPMLKGRHFANALYLEHPEVRRWGENSILLLPTTHTLKKMFRLPKQYGLLRQGVRYRLVYFHDYDLLRWQVYAAVLLILHFGGTWRTCRQVAATLLNSMVC